MESTVAPPRAVPSVTTTHWQRVGASRSGEVVVLLLLPEAEAEAACPIFGSRYACLDVMCVGKSVSLSAPVLWGTYAPSLRRLQLPSCRGGHVQV